MWLSNEEILNLGFNSVGTDALIDSRAMILGAPTISIGDSVRIDAFSVLSSQGGRIDIGNNVHIATKATVYGAGGVEMESGSGLATGVVILSATDDYVFGYLTNPTMSIDHRLVTKAPVVLGKHVVVGANSVVLPGSNLGFGVSVGALTLVRGVIEDYSIVAGNPGKVIGKRSKVRLDKLDEEYSKRIRDSSSE
jgi:acetyltransferase-like isoleucine patch superfamily enzyme